VTPEREFQPHVEVGTKASVVQVRAEAKDYIDLDALFSSGKADLSLALAAAQKLYGTAFNPEVTLKALSYFDDGNLRDLPEATKDRLATAAREVDLERLPEIERAAGRTGPDYGPMKPIPVNPQTLELASNIIWFEEPERALADPVRFMAYAMTYALPEDMRAIRQ